MKKAILTLVVIMFMIFLYLHQGKTLTTGEAIVHAMEILQDPPKGWGSSIKIDTELNELPSEHIRTVLNPRQGFLNELFNRKQWEVTIIYGSNQPTIVMDAATGKFIDLYGPLN